MSAETAGLKKLEALVKSQATQIKSLEKQVTLARDIQEIEKLQRAYGYYLEHWMVEEVLDCFSDSPECELDWMEGKWLGKKGVSRYFETFYNQVKDTTFLHQLMQVSAVIDVDPDGKRARGRWYGFGRMCIPHGPETNNSFAAGIYENEYIKENGTWKILKFSWTAPYSVKIPDGWVSPEERAERILSQPVAFEPDEPYTSDQRWVTGYIRPFHYNHPVTGKKTSEAARNAKLKKFKREKKK
jgi:hypothetical protein